MATSVNSSGAIVYSVHSGANVGTVNPSTGLVTITGAGNMFIKATVGADANYYASSAIIGSISIAKVAPTITNNTVSVTYGAPSFALNIASNSTGAITYSVLSGPATVSSGLITTTGTGPVSVQISQAADANCFASMITSSFTVSPAILTVTANNSNRYYGAANPIFGVTYSGFVNGDTPFSLGTRPTANSLATPTTPVGTASIVPSGGVASNYNFNYVNGSLIIDKVPLTVTATDASRVYGAANPVFTVSYSGFVNSETAANLLTPSTAGSAAVGTSPVNTTVSIVPSGGTSNNYTFNYVNGSLTITKAPLTVTITNASKTYGAVNPTFTATYSGFVNGESTSVFSTSPSFASLASIFTSVGNYSIDVATFGNAANYSFSYVSGTLTITPATLTVKALDNSSPYGSNNTVYNVTYSGFVNSEGPTDLPNPKPTASCAATSSTPVGTVSIIPSGGTVGNYSYNYVNGTLTITKAPLTVTAVSVSKFYGNPNPTFLFSYAGFMNGETQADLMTTPTATCAATTSTPAGTISSIIPSGGTSNNYSFSYVNGSLSVSKRFLIVTANDASKSYGANNPTFTATYSGFVNGESVANLITPPTFKSDASIYSSGGTIFPIYMITPGSAANYLFNYVNGNLDITPVPLTVTASNASRTYGLANPVFILNYSGFVNGESVSDIVRPVATCSALPSTPVGSTVNIVPSGGLSGNYTFVFVNGTLTINPAPLTVTANNASRVYGAANPAFTMSYTGFVNGEGTANLTTVPTATSTATATTPVGSVNIVPSGGVSGNYTFTYVTGSLSITKASLTVMGVNATRVYGATNPVFTVSYSGFVNGDTQGNLTTPPTVTSTATATTPVGSVNIVPSGGVSGNYTFTYANGILSITKASLTVAANNTSRSYGSANPAFTIAYSGFVNSETQSVIDILPVVNSSTISSSNAGLYTGDLVPSGGSDNNYSFTYIPGNLTITSINPVITFNDLSKNITDPDFTLGATSTSPGTFSYTDQTLSPAIATLTGSLIHLGGSLGTVNLQACVTATTNYNALCKTVVLTVSALPVPSLTFNNVNKNYGNPAFDLTAASNSSGSITYSVVSGTGATVNTTGHVIITGAGQLQVQASQAATSTFAAATSTATINIASIPLTVTANNASRVYGAANPAFTMSYTGFVNGEGTANLTTVPTATSTATATTPVGSVNIVPSGGVSGNYTFTYVTGSLSITKASLTVMGVNATRVYGATNPVFTVSYSGFVNGDTQGNLTTPPTVTSTATATTPVGSVNIVPSGGVSGNYTFTYANGILSITKASLTVAANNTSRSYGSANPAFTIAYSGFVNSETQSVIDILPVVNSSTISSSNAGLYTGDLVPSGGSDNNYSFTYIPGNLTITSINPVITFNDLSKNITDPDFTLGATSTSPGTFSYTDQTLSPAIATLTGSLIHLGGSLGTVNLQACVTATTNYNALCKTVVLTVSALPVPSLTFNNVNKNYGNPAFDLTAASNSSGSITYSVVSGTGATVNTTGHVIITGAGQLQVQASQAATSTFAAATSTATINIASIPLTVTANNASRVYGAANPAFTMSYTGFVNGEGTANLTTVPTATSTATATTPVGSVNIVPSGGVSGNYTFTYVTGSLSITKASLTVMGVNATRVYGATNPVFTVSYSGFVNGDTQGNLTTPPTVTSTATATTPVGSVNIVPSGGVSGNYTFTYANGILSITKASLTVAANNTSRSYGSANPAFTIAYSGFVNSETQSVIDILPVVNSSTISSSNAGLYTGDLIPSGGSDNNYSFTYMSGDFTINKIDPVIVFSDLFKNNAAADFSLNATSTPTGIINYTDLSSNGLIGLSGTAVHLNGGTGSVNLQACTSATTNYNSVCKTAVLTISNLPIPTVTVNNVSKKYGDAGFDLAATSNSNGAITYSVLSGSSATVNAAGHVVITAVGQVQVQALQAATGSFGPSASTATITITQGDAVISNFTDLTKTINDVDFDLAATTNSDGIVSYQLLTGNAVSLSGKTIHILGSGVATLRASVSATVNYLAASQDITLTVNKLSQTITFGSIPSKTFGAAQQFTISATASSSLPVTFSVTSGPATILGGTVTITGAGDVAIKASQAGDANYNAANDVTQTFSVAKAAQTIMFGALATKLQGDQPFTLSVTASSTLAVAFSITSGPATVSGSTITLTGAGTVVVKASQAGNANYSAAADVSQSFCVTPSKPVISFSTANPEIPVLTSSSTQGNQWYLNGTAISNSTSATVNGDHAGSYTVQVTIGGCTSLMSDAKAVIVTTVEKGVVEFSCYPNPSEKEITIQWPQSERVQQVQIIDMSGRVMSSGGEEMVNKPITIESYGQGMFIINVKSAQGISKAKFIKK
ncbi:hypothetical protein WSM22_04220 [Cytophagales bacterium WSM2-2]|nr:hypothetical protein WSM22_04220 [Cytophagales bacterium WSM2-2]